MRKVQLATHGDHEAICAVAKKSKFTSGAANPHYLSESAYEKGWVGVVKTKAGRIVGFTVVRHCVRNPYTSLYYVGTDPSYMDHGVGLALVGWALRTSPHHCVRLICEHTNLAATEWYLRHGFTVTGEGANKGGVPYRIFEVRKGELK